MLAFAFGRNGDDARRARKSGSARNSPLLGPLLDAVRTPIIVIRSLSKSDKENVRVQVCFLILKLILEILLLQSKRVRIERQAKQRNEEVAGGTNRGSMYQRLNI